MNNTIKGTRRINYRGFTIVEHKGIWYAAANGLELDARPRTLAAAKVAVDEVHARLNRVW